MALGEKLCNARLAKKMTTSQVATATRMKVQTVECLEKEDFRRIAAPIYAKGFIRMYAECVGLDPKPLVEEYMARFGAQRGESLEVEGQPRVGRLLKGAGPAPEPPPPSAGPPERDLFDFAPAAAEPPVSIEPVRADAAPTAGALTAPLPPAELPPKLSTMLAGVVPKFRLNPAKPRPASGGGAAAGVGALVTGLPLWQKAAAGVAIIVVVVAIFFAVRGCQGTTATPQTDQPTPARPEVLRLAAEPPEPYAE